MPRRSKKVELDGPVERKRFRIRPAYLVLAALMALFAFKFLEKTQEVRHLAAQQAALQLQNDETARDNDRLQREIRYEHTTAFLEDAARAKLLYTKPGEVAVQTRPVLEHVAEMRAAPRPPPTVDSTWKQWWHAFFG